ncbi:hypothetical protein Q5752_003687 [Cryptotrichosporon argae]
MAQQPAQTLASHLIAQTLSSIALLEALQLLAPADAAEIRARLPSPYAAFPALAMVGPPGAGAVSPLPTPGASGSALDLSAGMGALTVDRIGGYPPAPHAPQQSQTQAVPPLPPRSKPEVRARALWDYHGTEADDLAFRQGDSIIIDEEVNEQWSRGRVVPQGQVYPLDRAGLFPANYVEKLPPGPAPPPPINPSAMVPYQPAYAPSAPGSVVVAPPQQQVVVAPADDGKKPGKFGKYGSQLGHAAVNGAGFGFGASVASNIVNAIL